jgi:hypothetical protein
MHQTRSNTRQIHAIKTSANKDTISLGAGIPRQNERFYAIRPRFASQKLKNLGSASDRIKNYPVLNIHPTL